MDTAQARAWIEATAAAVAQHKDRLTELDAAIGDADHGTNLHRGFTAVLDAIDGFDAGTVGKLLTRTGTTLISSVGGASGPLYGSAFRAAGKELDTPEATAEQLLAALRAGLEAIQALGAAVPGDKTMVDAYAPALDAFQAELAAGDDLAAATRAAAQAAAEGAQATVELQARKGRASYLGERSIGHQDPGATSTALLFEALAEAVATAG